jgi:2-amino-4-hydroxy-6-hydroxymethyldihydropteridine diphosphokinase
MTTRFAADATVRAAVAFGGNLGRPDEAFAFALSRLARGDEILVRSVSSLYQSAPWGRTDQPSFLNGCASIETSLSAQTLLEHLLELERSLGRQRIERWGPRALDLDLLYYGSLLCSSADLMLPHPGIEERTFVLEPLSEIEPAWRHPRTGRSAREMLEDLNRRGGATECRRLNRSMGQTLS